MLLHRGEAKILAAEKEQRVEQDDGRVRAQLFAVPKKLLLHPRMDATCRPKRGPPPTVARGSFGQPDTAQLTTGCDRRLEIFQHKREFC